MKEIINKTWEIYKEIASIGLIVILLVLGIFGGEWKLSIQFSTLKGLVEAIKNYRK